MTHTYSVVNVFIFSTGGVLPVRATVSVIQNLDEACPSQETTTNEINKLKTKIMDLITNCGDFHTR